MAKPELQPNHLLAFSWHSCRTADRNITTGEFPRTDRQRQVGRSTHEDSSAPVTPPAATVTVTLWCHKSSIAAARRYSTTAKTSSRSAGKTKERSREDEVLRPLGEHPFVERHAHRVVLVHRPVEYALHQAVCPERLADSPVPPVLGVELHRAEPPHVLCEGGPDTEQVSRGALLCLCSGSEQMQNERLGQV